MDLSLRISSETATFEDIIDLLDPITSKYIVALEHASSRHFQCYLYYIQSDDLKCSKLRYLLKTKGFSGNKSMSLTKMRNPNLMIYVLKEGDYKYKGFTDQEIESLASKSYDKPKSYKARKKEIDEVWWHSEKPYSMESKCNWLEDRINLLVEFEMGYNRTRLKQEFDTLYFSRFPDTIKDECEKFFSS